MLTVFNGCLKIRVHLSLLSQSIISSHKRVVGDGVHTDQPSAPQRRRQQHRRDPHKTLVILDSNSLPEDIPLKCDIIRERIFSSQISFSVLSDVSMKCWFGQFEHVFHSISTHTA